MGILPLPVGLLPNPKFTKRGTRPHIALHGILAWTVRGFCRTERDQLPTSPARDTSTHSVNIGLSKRDYSASSIGTQMPDS